MGNTYGEVLFSDETLKLAEKIDFVPIPKELHGKISMKDLGTIFNPDNSDICISEVNFVEYPGAII